MKPNSDRQSAIVVSRVKDLSKISNPPDWVGMFAVVTPWGPTLTPNLIKDVDSLDSLYGDPRIDPDRYRDLYIVRDIISSGIACNVVRVESGSPSSFSIVNDSSEEIMTAITSINGNLKLSFSIIAVKPDNLGLKYLSVRLSEIVTEEPLVLSDYVESKVALSSGTTNQSFIATLNSVLGSYLKFTLGSGFSASGTDIVSFYLEADPQSTWSPTANPGTFVVNVDSYINAFEQLADPKFLGNFISELCSPVTEVRKTPPIESDDRFLISTNLEKNSAASNVRAVCTAVTGTDQQYNQLSGKTITFTRTIVVEPPSDTLSVSLNGQEGTYTSGNIINIAGSPAYNISFQKLEDGEWLDLANDEDILTLLLEGTYTGETSLIDRSVVDHDKVGESIGSVYDMTPADRRSLQYHIKELASDRSDLTCIFSTPYGLTYSQVCDWVSSSGVYSYLWEYGSSSAIDYKDQSYYCEIYWNWVNWKVTKLVNNSASSVLVSVVPSGFVIGNTLMSFRERGVSFPVAGDQRGTLPAEVEVISNPGTREIRDLLVQHRINPIYDTGTRGVQIYGNETLNPSWSDLSAAHIARMLVIIRHRVHEFTESCKFMLNGVSTWEYWKNTVSTTILNPIQSEGGLNWYEVKMGNDTTTPEERAARIARGQIRLQFVSDVEIFDLEFVVESSAASLE